MISTTARRITLSAVFLLNPARPPSQRTPVQPHSAVRAARCRKREILAFPSRKMNDLPLFRKNRKNPCGSQVSDFVPTIYSEWTAARRILCIRKRRKSERRSRHRSLFNCHQGNLRRFCPVTPTWGCVVARILASSSSTSRGLSSR